MERMDQRMMKETASNSHVLGGINLLYVEDEALLREEVAIYLRRRVQHLYLAADGLEALEILKTQPIDAVMTDLLMPNMDGISLLKSVRDLYPDMPFIIATAINDFKTMQDAMQLGVLRFLIKPFQTDQIEDGLAAITKRVLKNRGLETNETKRATEATAIGRTKTQISKTEADLARILKETTLKGPNRVTLNICANLLEIIVVGGYTKMELTLLENPENHRFVSYYRETYYQHIKEQLKKVLNTNFHCHHQLLQISCSSKKQMDILRWVTD